MLYMEEMIEIYGRKALEVSEAIMAEEDAAYAETQIAAAKRRLLPEPLPAAPLVWEELVESRGYKAARAAFNEISDNDAEFAFYEGGK